MKNKKNKERGVINNRWQWRKNRKNAAIAKENVDDSQKSKSIDPQQRLKNITRQLDNLNEVDLEAYGAKILSVLAKENELLQAVIFIREEHNNTIQLRFACGYACSESIRDMKFSPGDGLPGQVYNDGKLLNLKKFPEGYIKVKTALGEASPRSLILIPLINRNETIGIMELASFKEFNENDEQLYIILSKEISANIKNLIENKVIA